MVVTTKVESGQLADLVKQVQAGNEVVLLQGDKPVARVVAAHEKQAAPRGVFRVRSFKDHKVLTPVISQAEIADEMFGGE